MKINLAFNPSWGRSAASIGIVAAALLIYQALEKLVGGNLPHYLTFYPAVIIAALFAGFGAGILSTVTAALLAVYWILPPGGFAVPSFPDAVGLAIFSFNCLLITVIIERYRHARQRAADYAADLALRDERKRTEDALRMSEARLRLAQDAAKAGAWEWDLATNRNVWSEEVWKLYGLEPHCCEPTYEVWRQTIHPDDREKVEPGLKEAAAKGIELNAEWRVREHDGSVRWLMARGRPLHDTDGRPVRYVGIVMDISESKLKAAYGEMSREILQILNEPGSLHEAIGRVLAALKTRTGFDAVGIRLQDEYDFPYFVQEGFPEDFLQKENTLIGCAADGGACRDKDGNVRLECTCGLVISGRTDPANPLFTPGGSFWTNDSFPLLGIPPHEDPRFHPRNECMYQGYASLALVPIRNKGKIVGLIQLNDRRKGRFTHDTVELVERIASHIGEALMRKLTERSLAEYTSKLEDANKDLESFAYSVSHDLRAPLRAIDGFSRMLIQDMDGKLDDEEKRKVNAIRDNAQRMSRLIDDLLSFSRLGRQAISSSVVNMEDLTNQVWEDCRDGIDGRRIELKIGELPPAFGDRGLMRQVLMNLVSNAIKFTQTREDAVIEIGGKEEENGNIYSIKDNGVGFDMRYQDKLFAVFQRLHRADEFEGTGVGLASVQRIIQRHGGRVWAEAKVNEGATFYFSLPSRDSHDR